MKSFPLFEYGEHGIIGLEMNF